MNKVKVFGITIVMFLAGGIFSAISFLGIKAVSAQMANGEYPLIIQNLAEKFGVSEDEVASVFEDTKAERETERLDKAVEEGTITEEQKNQIIAKQEEVEAKINEIDDSSMTSDERQEAMQTLHEELRTWADDNDIALFLVDSRGKMGHMQGKGMGMGMEMGDCFEDE